MTTAEFLALILTWCQLTIPSTSTPQEHERVFNQCKAKAMMCIEAKSEAYLMNCLSNINIKLN